MTNPDPCEIARKLSPAQREAILRAPITEAGFWVAIGRGVIAATIRALKKRGIISRWCFLTPLGLAVRAALQEMDHD